jgi:hypothetical protein
MGPLCSVLLLLDLLDRFAGLRCGRRDGIMSVLFV